MTFIYHKIHLKRLKPCSNGNILTNLGVSLTLLGKKERFNCSNLLEVQKLYFIVLQCNKFVTIYVLTRAYHVFLVGKTLT